MADEMVLVPEANAQLNITYAGQQGDYPDAVSYDLADGDVKQIASEAVRTGYVPGIDPVAEPDFTDFIVDRFPAKQTDEGELPPRLSLRPKTPFGQVSTHDRFVLVVKDLLQSLESIEEDELTTFELHAKERFRSLLGLEG